MLSKFALSLQRQHQLAIVHTLQRGRSLEGVVQPLVEIAIDEQLLPQQGDQIGRIRPVNPSSAF